MRPCSKAFAAKSFVARDAATIADWTDAPQDIASREARLFLVGPDTGHLLSST